MSAVEDRKRVEALIRAVTQWRSGPGSTGGIATAALQLVDEGSAARVVRLLHLAGDILEEVLTLEARAEEAEQRVEELRAVTGEGAGR